MRNRIYDCFHQKTLERKTKISSLIQISLVLAWAYNNDYPINYF